MTKAPRAEMNEQIVQDYSFEALSGVITESSVEKMLILAAYIGTDLEQPCTIFRSKDVVLVVVHI